MKEKLMDLMNKKDIDSFFISKNANIRYISGFMGDDSYLLITKNKSYIITDARYTEQAAIETPDLEIFMWRIPGKTLADAVAKIAEDEDLKAIGYEGDTMTADQYAQFKGKLKVEMVSCTGAIENMRSIKTAKEIEYQRAACEIACRAFERIIKEIGVGVTEKELAAKLSMYMVMEGADTQPYGNILISGTRTSLLHGIPSEKAIEYGDFVLMDFGCQFNGYMSDMTRTVVVGKPTAKQVEVYALEKQMVEDALSVIKADTICSDVYKASLKAIEKTEYFDYHYANIGHGIGLFVHEEPSFSIKNKNLLRIGNVCTVEPGIYIPGWGGVRIEEQVLVTKDGYENLISTTRDLIIL